MWSILLLFGATCYALEFARPVVARPRMRTWVWRVWAINFLQLPIVLATAWLWHALAGGSSVFGLSARASPWIAGGVAYVAYTFAFYWWHRARHASDFIWRSLHQIHHSPRRLELVTAFYKHPLETLCNAALAALLLFPVLGLDFDAACVAAALAGLADVFYHSNVRTPGWVGWWVQRPEMHRLHHELGRHDGNYGDLPLWDWLFGTLRLPHDAVPVCGFDGDLEERLVPMIAFTDVHRPASNAKDGRPSSTLE